MNTSANDGNNNDDFDNNPTNNSNDQNERRKGKGRKKISMEKIENESNLQVTFSKRRAGVFKKASELSTLCGAQSAVVVFSPGNKPHSFGHPSVEAVANRFLNGSGGSMQGNAANPLALAHGEAGMQQRNRELVALEAQVEAEKNRRKQLDETAPTLDQLDYEQLEQMKNLCVILKQETEAKLKGNADQGLVSPAPGPGYGYGAANIVPTVPGGSSAATSGYPFGYNLPYPPTGPGSFGFSYDGTTGMASGSGSGTGNNPSTHEDADDPAQGSPDQGTGFGGNYGHSF